MEGIKDVVLSVLNNLQKAESSTRQRLWNEWPKIVGSKIASHTRPSLANAGLLCVWVDQSALAFELNQKYKQTILRRVQASLGENEVQTVIFRVGQLR